MSLYANTRRSLIFVIINAIFAAFFAPILFALLLFSTPRSRHTLIFHLNIIAVLLGIAEGFLLVCLTANDLLTPSSPVPPITLTTLFTTSFYSPLLVESILILRLVAVFPTHFHGRRTLYTILLFPALVKLFRVVTVSILAVRWIAAVTSDPSGEAPLRAAHLVWLQSPYVKICWILQLLDTTCVCSFLVSLPAHRASTDIHRHYSCIA
jgi:hypothetical protein